MTIKEICASFNVEGDYVSCEEVPTGNINSTFKVEYNKDGDLKHYIVQKINKNVFNRPEEVMENISNVTICKDFNKNPKVFKKNAVNITVDNLRKYKRKRKSCRLRGICMSYDEHEMMIEYSEMTAFNFNSKE